MKKRNAPVIAGDLPRSRVRTKLWVSVRDIDP